MGVGGGRGGINALEGSNSFESLKTLYKVKNVKQMLKLYTIQVYSNISVFFF